MKIKNTTYPSNLIQGPLAGVSCGPFRALAWEWGKPAFAYTEMSSCKNLINKPKHLQRRFTEKHPDEGPLGFQLSSNNADELGLATKIVTDCGADLIDLNCGCPVKKIRSKAAGSHLLSEPGKIYKFITAMKNNTDRPVSIKIRVDADSNDNFNQDMAKAIADAQPDFITVHGRHWTHKYDVDCAYDDIAFFVDALNIPVIGNGDVACLDSLKRMFATGCAGVMIGRASVGQPWLFAELKAQINGDTFTPPSTAIIGTLFLKHLAGLCDLLQTEKSAIIQARCFAKYYARKLEFKEDFCSAFNQCTDLKTAQQVIERYFGIVTLNKII